MSKDSEADRPAALIRAVMTSFSRGELDEMFELLHDDIVVEHPYETGHGVDVLDKAGFRQMIDLVQSMYERFVIVFDRVLPLADGLGVVAEYHGDAVFLGSGVPYANTYCGVFMVSDGAITHWREYDNPLILRAALEEHFAHASPQP